MATRPRWCLGMLGTKRRTFGNIVGHAKGVDDLASLSSWTTEQFDPRLSWSDVEWIKERWGGKLILKGILDKEDAIMAAKTGADAIIVSNHGGRQLDGAPSSISVLPEIVDAVGDKIEVHIDGGIRSGQDVLKALCLGAKGTYIGRPFLYGLGALGKPGVTKALEIIRKEMDITLALCGKRTDQRSGSGYALSSDGDRQHQQETARGDWRTKASIFSKRLARPACASTPSATCMAGSTCSKRCMRASRPNWPKTRRDDWRIIHLGDYVDRGPDSKGVLDMLIDATSRDERMIALAGNHDTGFLDFLAYPDSGRAVRQQWRRETALSYGVSLDFDDPGELARGHALLKRAVPQSHIALPAEPRLLRSSFGDFFFCHAGIRPGVPLERQDPRDLLWIRGEFLNYPGLHPKVIVHGHTPHAEPEVMANRVNVDTFACRSGVLTALVIDGADKRLLSVSDRDQWLSATTP